MFLIIHQNEIKKPGYYLGYLQSAPPSMNKIILGGQKIKNLAKLINNKNPSHWREFFYAGPTRLELATSCVTGGNDKKIPLNIAFTCRIERVNGPDRPGQKHFLLPICYLNYIESTYENI